MKFAVLSLMFRSTQFLSYDFRVTQRLVTTRFMFFVLMKMGSRKEDRPTVRTHVFMQSVFQLRLFNVAFLTPSFIFFHFTTHDFAGRK
jgi:hypothetical protein